jgi:hypothetical protein
MTARFSPPPPFAFKRSRSARFARGRAYEEKVHKFFEQRTDFYLRSQWIREVNHDGKVVWHQTDGLHFNIPEGIITIIEVKYQHCVEALGQMRRYQRLIRELFPDWRIRLVEVVKWYDPDVRWVGEFHLCPDALTHDCADEVPGIHILKPGHPSSEKTNARV